MPNGKSDALAALPDEIQNVVKEVEAETPLPPLPPVDDPLKDSKALVWIPHHIVEDERLADFCARFQTNQMFIWNYPSNAILFDTLFKKAGHTRFDDFLLEKGMIIYISLTPQAHANYNSRQFDSLHKRMDRMEETLRRRKE